MEEREFCVRVKFQLGEQIRVVLGKFIGEDNEFLQLKTGNGNVVEISKKHIILKEVTRIPFAQKKEEY